MDEIQEKEKFKNSRKTLHDLSIFFGTLAIFHESIKGFIHWLWEATSIYYNGPIKFFQIFSISIILLFTFYVSIRFLLYKGASLLKKDLPVWLKNSIISIDKFRRTLLASIISVIAILVYSICMIINYVHTNNSKVWIFKTSWANAPKKEIYMSIMKEDLENFKKDIESATDGEIKIDFQDNEPQDQNILFKQLSEGKDLHMLYSVQYYWPDDIKENLDRAGDFFSAVPFGKDFEEMNDWIENGGGQELWDEFCEKKNVKPFAFGHSGRQYSGWFKDSLNFRVDTLRVGDKPIFMRIPPLQGEVIKKLNGNAELIMGTSIIHEMENNKNLNGVEWVGPYEDLVLTLPNNEKYRYYYKESWHEKNTMFGLYINNDKYKRLEAKNQEILKQVIAKYNLKLTLKFAIRNEWALSEIKSQRGKSLFYKEELPSNVKVKLSYAWDEVMKEHLKNSEFKKIADSYNSHHLIWVAQKGNYYKSDTSYHIDYK